MKDKYTDSLHNDANNKLYEYGRDLRKDSTEAEKVMWKCLRGRKLQGYKFRRQHPLERYIADFYCHEKRLVIELDGSVHDERMNENYDEVRTQQLNESGIRVIRFRNELVLNNIDMVLTEIKKYLIP